MSIAPVGPYTPVRRPTVARPSATVQSVAQPTGGSTAPVTAVSTSEPSLGRLASWAGGAFGAFRLSGALGFNPAGWALAGVLAGGAFIGNKLYDAVTGGGGLNTGEVGKYAAWGGGAFGALKLARALNFNPAGWALAGVLAGGAFVGNKLYQALTGR